MTRKSKWLILFVPASLGMGAAWLYSALIRSEPTIKKRIVELQLQLDSKALLKKN